MLKKEIEREESAQSMDPEELIKTLREQIEAQDGDIFTLKEELKEITPKEADIDDYAF
jgi:hypothetical protein